MQISLHDIGHKDVARAARNGEGNVFTHRGCGWLIVDQVGEVCRTIVRDIVVGHEAGVIRCVILERDHDIHGRVGQIGLRT